MLAHPRPARRRTPRIPLRAAVLSAAVLAAACGSPSPAASPSSAAPTAVAPTTAAVPSDLPATPAAPAGVQRCHTPDVAVQFLTGQGAAGHAFRSVAFHNTSGGTCTVYGYVGMLMLDAGGHPLPTVVQRGGGMLGTPAPTTVTLPPMAIAYFELEFSDVQQGPSPCPTSAQVEVTPPDETTHLIVGAQLTPCANGRLIITALHSGAPRA